MDIFLLVEIDLYNDDRKTIINAFDTFDLAYDRVNKRVQHLVGRLYKLKTYNETKSNIRLSCFIEDSQFPVMEFVIYKMKVIK